MKRFAIFFALFCVLLLQAAPAQQTQPFSTSTSPAADLKSTVHQESSEAQGNPEARVWVNTKSGVYHCPATRWYGTTKAGSYMKQSEAQQKGFVLPIIAPASRNRRRGNFFLLETLFSPGFIGIDNLGPP
jgi:hypothetical protein